MFKCPSMARIQTQRQMDVRQWREYKHNDKWMSVNGENTNSTTNGCPSMARIQTQRQMDVRQWREYKHNDKWMAVNGENTNTTTNGWPSMARIQTQRQMDLHIIVPSQFTTNIIKVMKNIIA